MKNNLSVITVTYNCRDDLKRTCESLYSQAEQSFDHIVIDGGSTDGTLDVIKSYEGKIDFWVSEPDQGIYDAMNKGLRASNCDYVQFLNAGDLYASKYVISEFFRSLEKDDYDVVFGEIFVTDKRGNKIFHTKPLGFNMDIVKSRGTASVNHQAFFIKRELAPYYSLRYDLKSELNWYLDILEVNKNIKSFYIEKPLIRYQLGGAGNIYYLKNLLEWVLITQRRFGLVQNLKNLKSYKRFLEYNKRIRPYVFDA